MMNANRYIGRVTMAAAMLTAVACSDFTDYNEAVQDNMPQGNNTLWQNISDNSELSQFKELVQQAGYAEALQSDQYRTVWAPKNGTFNFDELKQLNATSLRKQFVLNHIANYSHNAVGVLKADDQEASRVLMLNEKVYDFLGSEGNYTFDGVHISQANMPSSNGVLHVMDGPAQYYPNMYELMTDSDLYQGLGVDTMVNLFKHYEHTYLDEANSVVGPIVNGMQTYIDSVMVTTNDLTRMLNVGFANEDSSYTMLLPNNEAWTKAYEKVKPNYNYIAATKGTVWRTVNGTVQELEETANLADLDYTVDSLVKMNIINGLVFSNNNGYNKWLTGTPSYLGSDTLRSTTRTKFSNPRDLLAAASKTMKMSNGQVMIVDSLPYLPWEAYSPKMTYSAVANAANITQGVGKSYSVRIANVPDSLLEGIDTKNMTSLSYAYIEPDVPDNLPSANFYLPNVQSTTYDIYCVFMPAWFTDEIDNPKPNLLKFTLNYYDEKGKKKTYTFQDTRTGEAVDSFRIEPYKIDSLYLGTFTFPVCYAGLESNNISICPNIQVANGYRRTEYYDRDAGLRKRDYYAHGFRIASFVLKPKELVEYENPKTKVDNENPEN